MLPLGGLVRRRFGARIRARCRARFAQMSLQAFVMGEESLVFQHERPSSAEAVLLDGVGEALPGVPVLPRTDPRRAGAVGHEPRAEFGSPLAAELVE